jgi:hypothetical protein
MKRAVVTSFILAVILSASVVSQQVASFGTVQTSLSTTSTGAVTGTAFALPGTGAAVITWQIVANGSALNTTLQGSLDNSSWAALDTQTTATGGIKSIGFTAVKFVRIIQTSRTGGTSTVGTITAQRTNITGGQFNAPLLFSPDNTHDIGTSTATNRPNDIFAGQNITTGVNGRFIWSGRSQMRSFADGTIQLANQAETDFGRLQFGGTTSSFPSLKRSGGDLEVKLADDSAYTRLNASSILTTGTTFGNLGSTTNGAIIYCSDCLYNSNPCSGASTGAIAKRINGAWRCD